MILNIRLRKGIDDGIKDWWLGFREGERSDKVREVLRKHIRGYDFNPTTKAEEAIDIKDVSFKKVTVAETSEDVNKKVDALIDNLR